MAEVVLFHHAQGLTPGVIDFADELRQAGHAVRTPDLFEGRTFGSIEDGMGYAQEIGFPDEVIGRGARAVEGLPAELVYAGFSLGVLPAQKLAQTRPGARGRGDQPIWHRRGGENHAAGRTGVTMRKVPVLHALLAVRVTFTRRTDRADRLGVSPGSSCSTGAG